MVGGSSGRGPHRYPAPPGASRAGGSSGSGMDGNAARARAADTGRRNAACSRADASLRLSRPVQPGEIVFLVAQSAEQEIGHQHDLAVARLVFDARGHAQHVLQGLQRALADPAEHQHREFRRAGARSQAALAGYGNQLAGQPHDQGARDAVAVDLADLEQVAAIEQRQRCGRMAARLPAVPRRRPADLAACTSVSPGRRSALRGARRAAAARLRRSPCPLRARRDSSATATGHSPLLAPPASSATPTPLQQRERGQTQQPARAQQQRVAHHHEGQPELPERFRRGALDHRPAVTAAGLRPWS